MARLESTGQPSLMRSQKMVTADSYPGLGAVHDRSINALHDMLARFGCRGVVATKGDTEILSAAACRKRSELSALCRFSIAPFKGNIGLVIDPELIVRLVDIFYGGSGDTDPFGGSFRSADLRLISRIGANWVDALPSIWRDTPGIAPVFLPPAEDASSGIFGRSTKVAVQNCLVTGLGPQVLSVSCVYPVDVLNQMPALSMEEPSPSELAHDPAWQARLRHALMGVSLPVRTVFARPEVPLSQLLVLKPGDIIPVCLPSTIPVTIAGRIFAEGTVGESSGRAAIRISRIAEGCLLND